MNNVNRLEIIKCIDDTAVLEAGRIIFKIDNMKIMYDIAEKTFYMNKTMFGKIPHVLSNGMICLYGNVGIKLNEKNEEISLKKISAEYIPWLLRLPLELKLLEFFFEIEYYIVNYLKMSCEYKVLKKEGIYKKIRIDTVEDLWTTIDEMENFLKYELYIAGYEDYSIYFQKVNEKIFIERDLYKKARQRITGKKCNNINGKTAFIGVGSVNSYIIKYCLANGVNDLVLVDHDKFTEDNAFRFAFPYKGKKKGYAVKEFCRNLDNINLQIYNININAESNPSLIKGCNRIIVSVDNFMSWLDSACYISKNCDKDTIVILAAINNFGENAKYVLTTKDRLMDMTIDFLFNSKVEERKELIGNGCGKSIAIYDEEILVKLAKKIVSEIRKDESRNEIVYVSL